MHRVPLAALLPIVLCAASAQAQTKAEKPEAPKADKPQAPKAEKAAPRGEGDADRRIQEAVQREVAKAKEEIRDEVRAEMQGAQAAAAFLGPPPERPGIEFLELHGYLRLRPTLFDNLDLDRDHDPSGYYLFPRPIIGSRENFAPHGTQTSANMRFRLEPTLNVSDEVRVRAQLDMLDNLVLGSTPDLSIWDPQTFAAPGQAPPEKGVNSPSAALAVKRAWAEVQTPLGLLSFGRMPSSWGLGVLSHAGPGIDDDFGDTVDRVQFAIPVGATPLGSLVVIPIFDYWSSGLSSAYAPEGTGLGQPFDLDQGDDGRGVGLKVVRLDSDDDVRRKLEKRVSSFNWGLWYSYRSQTFDFPAAPPVPASTPTPGTPPPTEVRRGGSAHTLDLWARLETRGLHLEAEVAGIYGEIGDAGAAGSPLGPVLLRQLGGAVQAWAKLSGGKVRLGGEAGAASGDRNPGFGNRPGRGPAVRGDIDGRQFAAGDGVLDIRNFRFNRAYRVDQVLWREILGPVTDAWYVKPTLHYEFLTGLTASAQMVYSQAFYASSTPSVVHKPLGFELDGGLRYASDDGFIAWVDYGLFFPLEGLKYPPDYLAGATTPRTDLSRGHALRAGLAVKF